MTQMEAILVLLLWAAAFVMSFAFGAFMDGD